MSHITALSPFGPIFGKELRTTARRRRTYLLRMVYLGALMLFLLAAYAAAYPRVSGSVAWRAQQQAELGHMFFVFFGMFSVIAMALLGPVLTATAISSERLHKTLHVLLMTPISSFQIVAGKLMSRLWIALTLLGLSLPVLALVRLLGGVEVGQMFGVICIAAATALFSAAIGLLLSTIMNRAYAVILLSYAAMLVLYLFTPMMVLMSQRGPGNPGSDMLVLKLIGAGNPVMTAGILVSGEAGRMGLSWVPCVIVHVTLAMLLLIASALLLRRIAQREGAIAVQTPNVPPLPPPVAADSATPVSQLPSPISRAREVWDNPVLWRELRRPLMPRRGQRIAGVIACLFLLFLSYGVIYGEDGLTDSSTQIGYAFIFNAMLCVLACVLAATAIAQEKESDTWTTLLSTPVSGWAIVSGKVLGLLRRMMWPVVLMAAHFVIFAVAGIISPRALLLTLWVMLSFNLIWIGTGLFLSLRLSSVTYAVGLNLLLPVAAYLFVFLAFFIVGQVFFDSYEWGEWVLLYLPYYYFGEGIWELSRQGRASHPGAWLPILGNVTHGQFLATAFAVGLLHVLATVLIIWYTAARFDAIVGRARQYWPLAIPPAPVAANA